jgi:hypothetical protein
MTPVLLETRDDEMLGGVHGSLLSLEDDWCSVLGYPDSLTVLYQYYVRLHVVSVASACTATGRSGKSIEFSIPRIIMRRGAHSFPCTSVNLFCPKARHR